MAELTLTSELLQTIRVEMAKRPAEGDARRLFHGRGHRFPGLAWLTVDWYPPALLVRCYRDEPADVGQLVDALTTWVPEARSVVVHRRQGRDTRIEGFGEPLPEPHVVYEAGLRYEVNLTANQNVGLFLDMAPVRQWVRGQSENASVLNLFAYTCAFGVCARAGGATEVTNNDMAKAMLDWGRRNHALNDQNPQGIRYWPHNLMKSWGKVSKHAPFDLIIADPPTNQGGSFNAERHYPGMLKRLSAALRPGGQLVACLNSPFLGRSFLTDQATRHAPGLRFAQWLDTSPDFPEADPDRGLKVALFRRLG